MVQKSNLTEMNEKKEDVDGGKKSDSDNEKPTVVNSEVTRNDVQEESVKAEGDTAAEPASGKEEERSRDEGVIEGQKQEGNKSVNDK